MPAGLALSRGGSMRSRGSRDPITNAYKVYNTAARQQAEDYGGIMSGYKKLLESAGGGVENLGELARTGGYSEADKANLRARGVSPIRSVYAGAQRDIDRQRGIQGGYSPGYGALKAKMARELSQNIADQVTDVEAGIAQNVAQNRIATAGQFAGMTPEALSGQRATYGTTPALVSTYGNLAGQQAALQQRINEAAGPRRRRSSGSAGLAVSTGRPISSSYGGMY